MSGGRGVNVRGVEVRGWMSVYREFTEFTEFTIQLCTLTFWSSTNSVTSPATSGFDVAILNFTLRRLRCRAVFHSSWRHRKPRCSRRNRLLTSAICEFITTFCLDVCICRSLVFWLGRPTITQSCRPMIILAKILENIRKFSVILLLPITRLDFLRRLWYT